MITIVAKKPMLEKIEDEITTFMFQTMKEVDYIVLDKDSFYSLVYEVSGGKPHGLHLDHIIIDTKHIKKLSVLKEGHYLVRHITS
jgi:hypothetical protein